MRTTASNRRLRTLLTGIERQTLIPRPDFQRRLVWVNRDKLAFLKTVLDGYPFPEIYIAAGEVDTNTGEGTELLVDGQQRLTTLYQYFRGSPELKLGQAIVPYMELSEEQKKAFLDYDVVVRDLGQLDIEEVKKVFQRINSTSYALNAMEINNARYDGEFKTFGEHIADSEFFDRHRTFTGADMRRMNDVTFCLSLIITMMTTYFNRDDEIEDYLKHYDEGFSEKNEYDGQIDGVMVFIEDCLFTDKCRVWKKVDLFTLMVEVHRCLFKNYLSINPRKVGNVLGEFYDAVDRCSDMEPDNHMSIYRKAAIQATNDRGNRIRRGEIIYCFLKTCTN